MSLPVDRSGPPRSSNQAPRVQSGIAERIAGVVWPALHAFGQHRWRDGYVIDPERGMSQYRGSRCTICDSPWEGW
jgi:hypothetical protein